MTDSQFERLEELLERINDNLIDIADVTKSICEKYVEDDEDFEDENDYKRNKKKCGCMINKSKDNNNYVTIKIENKVKIKNKTIKKFFKKI